MKKSTVTKILCSGMVIAILGLSPFSEVYAADDAFLTRSVTDDLSLVPEFSEEDFPVSTGLDFKDSFTGLFLLEHTGSLYFYINNRDAKTLPVQDGSARISMATSADLSTHEHYELSVFSISPDFRFLKMKILGIAAFTASSRQYDISEIEFKVGGSFVSGRIGQRYTWTTVDGVSSYVRQDVQTVSLEVNYDSYRIPGLNSHAVTNYNAFTDVAYLTFPLDQDYGDLIGINLSWNEQSETIGPDGSRTYGSLEPKALTYSNLEYQSILGYFDSMDGFETFLGVLNPWGWFYGYSETADVSVIEKLTFPLSEEDDFLTSSTIDALNASLPGDLLNGIDRYVIRFGLSDYVVHNYSYYSTTLHMDVWLTEYLKTNFLDCDVLDLTFCKDGVVYTLGVASDSGDIITDDNPPAPKGWLTKLGEVLRVVLILVALFFLLKGIFACVNWIRMSKMARNIRRLKKEK